MDVNRILLTGFMGSGKTTVGPLIADQLGYRFIDLDERVEQAAGRPAADLFHQHGESRFRALETAVLTQALSEEDVVIATGGGALISEGTMQMAKDGGVVIYLKASVKTLTSRLEADKHRPLLKDDAGRVLKGGLLAERITEILESRLRFYEQAEATVEVDDMTPPDIAAAVVQAVLQCGVKPASETR